MPKHVLVESRGRRDARAFEALVADAHALLVAGHDVTLALLEDGTGVTVGREAVELRGLLDAGVHVWADHQSLATRAIDSDWLTASLPDVTVGAIDDLSRWLLDSDIRVVWH